ncbi:MAG: DEAD/DEAH box helicase [Planctomycetota bacterium]
MNSKEDKIALFEHQKEAIEFLKRRWYNGALFMDCGLGKSRCILELLKIQSHRYPIKCLIVSPVSVMASWLDEIDRWTKFKKTIITHPENIDLQNNIFLISYDRVYRYLEKLETLKFSHLIIDESSKIRNITTQRFKSLIKLARKINHRFILTGTPIANSLMDLYTQIVILDFGKRLSSYKKFRERFFYKVDKFNYREKNGAKEEVFSVLRDIVFSKKSTELINQNIYIINKKVEFCSEQQARYYETLENMKKAKNLLVYDRFLFLKYVYKLLEICSGFELGTPAKRFDSNKDEILENMIFEISSKTVIFFNFIEEGERIKDILRAVNINFLELNSKMDIETRTQIIHRFKMDDSKVLVMNVKIGGFGLNLGFCQNIIFFGPPIFSLETYKQAVDRIHRVDSIYRTAFIFRLQVKGSLEEYVYKVIEHKGELLNALYDFFGLKSTLSQK